MNKFVLIVIAIVILAGVAFSGAYTFPSQNTERKPVTATVSCVDFNPPSTTDTVSFGGSQYDLIKTNAHVVEAAKFSEMKLVGQTADGKDIYTEPGSNYFSQPVEKDLIFVIQNSVKPYKTPYIFNIYLKDGVPIPSYITNCKTTGGSVSLVAGTASSVFPPAAFNKTDIIGLTQPDAAPAYIYDSNKTTLSFIQNLGAAPAGQLAVAAKNSNLPLYYHLGTMYLIDGTEAYEYLATDKPVDISAQGKKSLQIQQVTFVNTSSYSWWTPSCKPAIYLYPQKLENVNVKVNTTGNLTLTIPSYENGWNVLANPNGAIESGNASYPYLYYESKIPDQKVKVPDTGFVVTKNELGSLFDSLLPKLGLLSNESKEFKDYWEKVLPSSSYYFVGIMNEEAIDSMEPLVITPKPNTVIRVRLYFEALKNKKEVQAPVIETPKREGFTVVEWGGMVKTDQNNPFTCSQ